MKLLSKFNFLDMSYHTTVTLKKNSITKKRMDRMTQILLKIYQNYMKTISGGHTIYPDFHTATYGHKTTFRLSYFSLQSYQLQIYL